MKQSIENRLAELEATAAKKLMAIVRFETGEKKQMSLLDATLAVFHGAQGKTQKVIGIKWLGEISAKKHGRLPELAEALAEASQR